MNPPERSDQDIELSIVMPCLNEAETLALCIKKAKEGIQQCGLSGEILVADNGSNDGSQQLAESLGARVVSVAQKGYGNALRAGIEAAQGRFIVMGDADDSYDFSAIEPLVKKLKNGFDLVMGCRMPWGGGTIVSGAMPWKHQWIGNPVLSFIGQLFFRCPVTDFHCGLRGFTKAAYEKMELQTTGMEFASEMVIKATLKQMKIGELPVTLHKDGRSRSPHLRSWRDGWRHLRFMLLFSPRWLFLIPGALLMLTGLTVGAWLLPGPRMICGVELDIHTLLMAAAAVLIGFQAVCFALFTKIFAISENLLPGDARLERLFDYFSLEKGLLGGVLLFFLGLFLSVFSVFRWWEKSFGPLNPSETLRILIPGVMFLILGCQVICASFFFSILGLKRR